MIRRYKSGDLLRLIRGTNANFENTFKKSLEYTVPADILKLGFAGIRTLRGFDFTGARYLWAYLKLLDYKTISDRQGSTWELQLPPPSFTAIGVLEGEGHHAESRALREREVPLPEVSDSPNLFRPHLGEKIVVQEDAYGQIYTTTN